MKTRRLTVLVMLALVAGLGMRTPAQEVGEAGHELASHEGNAFLSEQGIRDAFRQTVLELQRNGEAQLAADAQGVYDAGSSCCGACCHPCGCAPCCCRPCGWDFGFELAFLNPYFAAGGPVQLFSNAFVANNPNTVLRVNVDGPEYDYELTPRLWLGFMGCCDIGWRVRYWEFDHASEVAEARVPNFITGLGQFETGVESLDMHVIDVELTYQTQLCRWCLLGSAGVRYAEATRTWTQDFVSTIVGNEFSNTESGELDFEGWGPTLSLEARRCLCGVTPFVLVRTSLLAGDFRERSEFFEFVGGAPSDFNFLQRDDELNTFWVNEIQLGVEWTRCTSWGAMYVRAGAEVQHWDRGGAIFDSSSVDREEDASDLMILGGILSVGFYR